MINSITVTNHLNESVTMELRAPEKSGFLVQGIDGLGPGNADINMTDISGGDGGHFNSSRIVPRNIVFMLIFLEKPAIEDARQNSYKYFPLKKRIKIEVETDNRTSYCYGYVESNEPDIFSSQEGCTISVICPNPFFYKDEQGYFPFSTVTPMMQFPVAIEGAGGGSLIFSTITTDTTRAINYEGDVDVGFVLRIKAVGPANDFLFINSKTLETIGIDSAKLIALTGFDIIAADEIVISTVRGNKYAILIRSGVTTSILSALTDNPKWLQLEKGDNIFAYTVDSGVDNLVVSIEYSIAYEGV